MIDSMMIKEMSYAMRIHPGIYVSESLIPDPLIGTALPEIRKMHSITGSDEVARQWARLRNTAHILHHSVGIRYLVTDRRNVYYNRERFRSFGSDAEVGRVVGIRIIEMKSLA